MRCTMSRMSSTISSAIGGGGRSGGALTVVLKLPIPDDPTVAFHRASVWWALTPSCLVCGPRAAAMRTGLRTSVVDTVVTGPGRDSPAGAWLRSRGMPRPLPAGCVVPPRPPSRSHAPRLRERSCARRSSYVRVPLPSIHLLAAGLTMCVCVC